MSENCPTCGHEWTPPTHVPAFAEGDRVAWSHSVATPHGVGSIVRLSYIQSQDPSALFGTVEEEVERNLWTVLLDGEDDPRTLTADELVRLVSEE